MYRPPNTNQKKKIGNHMKSIIFLCLAATLIAGCKKNNFPVDEFYTVSQAVPNSSYRLGPGDSIRIKVYDHDDFSGTYNIDDTGRISVPLILGVNTKGLTVPELEQKIASELDKNYIVNPKVSIDLVKNRPFCILGEVRSPGCFSGLLSMNTTRL